MKNIIYRVYNSKNKYQASYSSKLKGSKEWAISCADLTKGKVYEVNIVDRGLSESSKLIYSSENAN